MRDTLGPSLRCCQLCEFLPRDVNVLCICGEKFYRGKKHLSKQQRTKGQDGDESIPNLEASSGRTGPSEEPSHLELTGFGSAAASPKPKEAYNKPVKSNGHTEKRHEQVHQFIAHRRSSFLLYSRAGKCWTPTQSFGWHSVSASFTKLPTANGPTDPGGRKFLGLIKASTKGLLEIHTGATGLSARLPVAVTMMPL